MNLTVIQFQKDQEPVCRELILENAEKLTGIRDEFAAPTVWVVPESSLPELKRFSDAIQDRGVKHKAMELSRILLHGDRIAMVNGDFSSAGKLCLSIERFFGKVGHAAQRLFIIGSTHSIFARLKGRAKSNEDSVQDYMISSTRMGGYGLAPLMPPDTLVDEDLRKTYIGTAPEIEEVRLLIVRAAKLNDVVLIMGDTGTGKEIVAYEIHHHGQHPLRPFIAVNCGALPHDLFESELFGHEKGAFTGAEIKKNGLWRAANLGTLFLDEIGELALDLQTKVLRALQEKKIRPVGSEREEPVNARIIAATNRDLFSMVREGRFREDLYYRLRGYIIHTPALRDHREDIPLLAQSLWREIAGKQNVKLADSLITALCNYSWPGNVRELKMVLTHLHGLFGSQAHLEERHLEIVFAMQGQESALMKTQKNASMIPSMDIFSSCRRLKRTYEAIRAVEYLLKPVLEKKPKTPINPELTGRLNLLLNELDSLCRYPLSFTPGTYESVNLLRSRLIYFVGKLEEDPHGAYDYLKDCGREAIELPLAAISEEFDKALASF